MVVRENLEGLYIGHEHYIRIDDDPHAVAMATGVNTRQGSRRLLEFAFEHAVATGRKKVSIVHKANIMKALTGIFLETGLDLYERKYKGKFELDTVIVDACAMKLVLNPWSFEMLVTTNLFGDILSDLVAGLVGGLGMAPGANIGADAAIFEAAHGSAPDIAGKGIANPTALLLAAAMLLDHVKLADAAGRLRTAISATLNLDKVSHRRPGRKRRYGGLHEGAGEPDQERLSQCSRVTSTSEQPHRHRRQTHAHDALDEAGRDEGQAHEERDHDRLAHGCGLAKAAPCATVSTVPDAEAGRAGARRDGRERSQSPGAHRAVPVHIGQCPCKGFDTSG